MSRAEVFESVAEALERETSLDRLEARGTLRITLKAGGFDPRSVQADQMRVVIERLLPGELDARGIGDTDRVCRTLVAALPVDLAPAEQLDTPEAVFSRLGAG